MTRSHPPTLLTHLRRALEEARVPAGSGIVLAVSGGPDSMALLHGMALHGKKIPFRLRAVGVDHGLRSEASQELDLAEGVATELGVPFERIELRVRGGGNLQARARLARYRALDEVRLRAFGPEGFLATGHHKDDRAETVLLRVLRGSSLAGLGVLPPRAQELLRPLVRADRASIFTHLERHGVPFKLDPSNDNPRFRRVRVRKELLPLLLELSPNIVDHLVELADEALSSGEGLGLQREERRQLREALRDPLRALDLDLGHGLRLFRSNESKVSGFRSVTRTQDPVGIGRRRSGEQSGSAMVSEASGKLGAFDGNPASRDRIEEDPSDPELTPGGLRRVARGLAHGVARGWDREEE